MTSDLSNFGWGGDVAAAYARYDRPSRCPARVIRVVHGACTAMSAHGPIRASVAGTVLVAAARDPERLPRRGDWVVLHTWPDRRITVEAVLPRRRTP